jgi:hypothetical protein
MCIIEIVISAVSEFVLYLLLYKSLNQPFFLIDKNTPCKQTKNSKKGKNRWDSGTEHIQNMIGKNASPVIHSYVEYLLLMPA